MSGNKQEQKAPCPPGCLHEDSQGYCAFRAHKGHGRGCPPGPDCACYEPAEGDRRRLVLPPRREPEGYVHRPSSNESLGKDPRVLAMYQAGATDREIAEATGWAKPTVSRWRRRNGLPGNRRSGVLVDKEAMAIRLYEQGLSDGAVARSLGCSGGAVCLWRQRTGRAANHSPGWPKNRARKGENHGNEDHQHDAGGSA